MRLIGDVHGHYISYAEIAQGANYSIQVGDMGFSYAHFARHGLAPNKHVFYGGNHDNYDLYHKCPNALGDFGLRTLGGHTFFFIRGAFSIDKDYRTPYINWWQEEELNTKQSLQALKEYKKAKPSLVLSHDCPNVIRDYLVNNGMGLSRKIIETHTGRLLQEMFNMHKPDIWIFGHWHVSIDICIDGCRFICLPELGYIDI